MVDQLSDLGILVQISPGKTTLCFVYQACMSCTRQLRPFFLLSAKVHYLNLEPKVTARATSTKMPVCGPKQKSILQNE